MAMCDAPLCALPIAAEPFASATGLGVMAPFAGFGVQGVFEFRAEIFWATETQWRFIARDSDGEEMLGVTDKAPEEKVWYECEFIDVLRGASIVAYAFGSLGSVNVLGSELVFNGEVNHSVRVLVSGVGEDETAELRFNVTCSDGSARKRTLKIRGREL